MCRGTAARPCYRKRNFGEGLPKVGGMLAHGSNEDFLPNREGARRKGHPKTNAAISKSPVRRQRNGGDSHWIAHTKTPCVGPQNGRSVDVLLNAVNVSCFYWLINKDISANGQEKYS